MANKQSATQYVRQQWEELDDEPTTAMLQLAVTAELVYVLRMVSDDQLEEMRKREETAQMRHEEAQKMLARAIELLTTVAEPPSMPYPLPDREPPDDG